MAFLTNKTVRRPATYKISWWKRLCQTFKHYEWAMGFAAVAIIAAGVTAWFFSEHRSIAEAVHIAEPVFLGMGALSIILLWAQLRETNVWNRLLSYHQFFEEVPKTPLSDGVREALTAMGIEKPPTAYMPMSKDFVEKLWLKTADGKVQPAKFLVQSYLNEFEHFCGAISVGIVDEEYARELRGTRVIDAFFGYHEFIKKIRTEQEGDAKTRIPSASAEPFTSKYYLELQIVATRWHGRRKKELEDQEKLVSEADAKADEVRNNILQRGVPAKARN